MRQKSFSWILYVFRIAIFVYFFVSFYKDNGFLVAFETTWYR